MKSRILSRRETPPRRGFVYATTGRKYSDLARRAARTLKALHPEIPIDLFSDEPVNDPVFDREHLLERVQPYCKVEAIAKSRFPQTILLDADIIAVTRVDELFGMTDRYLISAPIGLSRPGHMQTWQRDIPRWFPVRNTGVMVYRQGRRIRQFARAWQRAMDRNDVNNDQPHFRRLAWDLGIEVGTVPLEYNLIQISHLDIWEDLMGAPRLLHIRRLHDGDPGDPETPLDWRAEIKPSVVPMIDRLLEEEALRAASDIKMHWTRRSALGQRLVRVWKRLTA